jgi:hypothetical protein
MLRGDYAAARRDDGFPDDLGIGKIIRRQGRLVKRR